MHKIYRASERGQTKTEWLESAHTFSFGNYYDASKMGFGPLRVINDDIIAPGGGFSTHPHDNMEIISIVSKGALQHIDSMGHEYIIREGDIQKMTAGTGIYHSEFNHSKIEPVHFLQIWIIPDKRDLPPAYEQKTFDSECKLNKLCLIASPTGEYPLHLNQEMDIYQSILEKDKIILHSIKSTKAIWIQIVSGALMINDEIPLIAGDGFALWNEKDNLEIRGIDDKTNFILFDMG